MSISSCWKWCGKVVVLTVSCSSAQKAADPQGTTGGHAGAAVAQGTTGGAIVGGAGRAGAGTFTVVGGARQATTAATTGGAGGTATTNTGGNTSGGSTGGISSTNTAGAASVGGRGGTGGAGNTATTASGGTAVGTVEPGCSTMLTELGQSSGDVCSIIETTAGASPINVLILLDKSASMTAVPVGDIRSKWVGVTSALAAALDPNDSSIRYGFLLYPYASPIAASTCELTTGEGAVNIQVGPAVETIPKINQIMNQTTPGGGTPTAAALASAYEYYTSGAGKSLDGQKYVLLVTDGGPNCNAGITCEAAKCTANLDKSGSCGIGVANCCDPMLQTAGGIDPRILCLDDGAVNAQINALRSQGIKTFVVGIPGTEAYATYLDGFAESGGIPAIPTAVRPHKYYEVRNEAELVTAFRNITASLVRSCVVPLAAKASDPTKLNVAVDCKALSQTSTGAVNWEYHTETPSVEIKGTTCDRIKTQGVNRIDIIAGCPTVISL